MPDKRPPLSPIPIPERPSLTRAEADVLAEGTKVLILWSGGNGPWKYVIAVDPRGERYAVPDRDYGKADDPMGWYNPLGDFVGPEHPFTRVWLRGVK